MCCVKQTQFAAYLSHFYYRGRLSFSSYKICMFILFVCLPLFQTYFQLILFFKAYFMKFSDYPLLAFIDILIRVDLGIIFCFSIPFYLILYQMFLNFFLFHSQMFEC